LNLLGKITAAALCKVSFPFRLYDISRRHYLHFAPRQTIFILQSPLFADEGKTHFLFPKALPQNANHFGQRKCKMLAKCG